MFPVGEEEDYSAARSLVFLKEPAGWACLYFDDAHAESYALIARPDLYWEGDSKDSRLIPFRQGELFSHNIHRGFATIRPHLDLVFRKVCFPNNVNLRADGVWSYAVPVCHERHKYNLDKRLLGGFPEARSYHRASAPFYVSLYPAVISCVSNDGTSETWEIGDKNRDRFQQALAGMLRGGMVKQRMTWGDAPGWQRHVVVLRDRDRFMLACMTDRHRRAEFCVADQRAYLAAEGKKYTKEVFQGRKVPAYLVHKDTMQI